MVSPRAMIRVLFVYSTHKNRDPSLISNLIVKFVYPNPFHTMQFHLGFLDRDVRFVINLVVGFFFF